VSTQLELKGMPRVTKLPPGKAQGADDLTKWSGRRLAGRSGVPDKTKRKTKAKRRTQSGHHRHGAQLTEPTACGVERFVVSCISCGNSRTFEMTAAQVRGRIFRCRCGYAVPPWE
jgi:hypothetical protein